MGKDKKTWLLIAKKNELESKIRIQSALLEYRKNKLAKLIEEHLDVLNQIEERKK